MTAPPAREWKLPAPVDTTGLPAHLPGPVAELLARRGIGTAEELRLFLDPPHRLPYDPQRMSGMSPAVRRLYAAVEGRAAVGVFGDFDVDGVTGTAIIAEGLSSLGIDVVPYLPRRYGEGHGLSRNAVDRMAERGASLIVTVDCGITAVDEVAYANSRGCGVIITDHHLPLDETPAADAVLNPKLPGGAYPFHDLCGAGLAFKLMQGLYEYYGQPWPPGLLELAALGTIADLVPLWDENRYIVRRGLESLSQTSRPGLRALYRRAYIDPARMSAETVSFQIAPRINSPGRMGHALDSYNLLVTRSDAEAERLADRIEDLNRRRRDVTREALAIARERVEADSSEGIPHILIVADERIEGGVAGIVAGRLTEMYRRPAVVMSVQDGSLVASARSVPGFNLVESFAAFRESALRYGGHEQAAGFTIARDKFQEVHDALTDYAARNIDSLDKGPELAIDAELEPEDLNDGLLHWIAMLEPFGQGNPAPVFLTRRMNVLDIRYMGAAQQHFALTVGAPGAGWTALGFDLAHNWVDGADAIELVYTIIDDRRQGPGGKALRILDFRPA